MTSTTRRLREYFEKNGYYVVQVKGRNEMVALQPFVASLHMAGVLTHKGEIGRVDQHRILPRVVFIEWNDDWLERHTAPIMVMKAEAFGCELVWAWEAHKYVQIRWLHPKSTEIISIP